MHQFLSDNGFVPGDDSSSSIGYRHTKSCLLYTKRHRRNRSSKNGSDVDGECTCGVSPEPSFIACLSVVHLMAKCRPGLVIKHFPMLVEVISVANSSSLSSTSSSSNAIQDCSAISAGNNLLESGALSYITGAIEACCLHLANSKRSSEAKLVLVVFTIFLVVHIKNYN